MLITYGDQLKIVSLDTLEKICDSSLKSTIDEDAIAKMVQQDCSEGIDITWQSNQNKTGLRTIVGIVCTITRTADN